MAESSTESVAPARAATSSCTAEEAAVFLLLLGEQAAADVIRYFNPTEIRTISHFSENIGVKNRDQLIVMLNQFERAYANVSLLLGDFQRQMRQTLQRALGNEQARCLVNPPDSQRKPLTGLQLMKPALLATMIRDEPEQFQAAVLACLEAEQASEVINLLPTEQTQGLLARVATMGRLPQASLEAIVTFLQSFLDEQIVENFLPINGEQQVANILNLFDNQSRDHFLDTLRQTDNAMAVRIEEQMLVFAQVVNLSMEDMGKLLGVIDSAELSMALKGEPDDVRQHVFRSMSKRAATYLREEIETLGAVPQSKVKEARQNIVTEMDRMLKDGDIAMPRGNEVMLE